MPNTEKFLIAHLLRRAGFGATPQELERYVAQGYEATVEELLNPEAEPVDRYAFLRYQPGFWKPVTSPGMGSAAFQAGIGACSPISQPASLSSASPVARGASSSSVAMVSFQRLRKPNMEIMFSD